MDYRWNNFHLYFSGGSQIIMGFDPDIVKALDEVIAELHFDLASFMQLEANRSMILKESVQLCKNSRGRDFRPEERARMCKLEEGTDIIYCILNKELEPVYERMIARGFSRAELIR